MREGEQITSGVFFQADRSNLSPKQKNSQWNDMGSLGTRVEKDPAMLQGQEHFPTGLKLATDMPYACMGSRPYLKQQEIVRSFSFFLHF